MNGTRRRRGSGRKAMSKLNARQSRFVEEYMIDLNATQAAIRAGYSKKTANAQAGRLLVNVSVQAAIQEGRQAVKERSQRTMDDVIADLRLVAKDAMQSLPDRDGNLVMINHNAAIKAIELEGKHYGGFVARQDHTSSDGTMTPSGSNLSGIELDRELERRGLKLPFDE